MLFPKYKYKTLSVCLSILLATFLGLSTTIPSNVVAAPTPLQSTTTCNYSSASLNPTLVYQTAVNNYLQNILNLPANPPPPPPINVNGPQPTYSTSLTVNSADLLQNFRISFSNTSSRGNVTFYNLNLGANFPATSTANLPRAAFDPLGVLAFYIYAGDLTSSQLQAVQNLYAADLTSRRNYGANLANLAKTFTGLQNSGADSRVTGYALDTLRGAYNTLSNPQLPAPNPRQVYRKVAIASLLVLLSATGYAPNISSIPNFSQISQTTLTTFLNDASKNQSLLYPKIGGYDILSTATPIRTGLNILAIGASNYDTNRLPIPGANNTPTQTTCSNCFPLAAFDSVRNTPLSAAQASPEQVFGQNVLTFLRKNGVPNPTLNGLNFQVNSADQLQFVMRGALSNIPTPAVFFAKGFPVTGAATLPEFAFSDSFTAGQFADQPSTAQTQAIQAKLVAYYSDPANAGRRTNYGKNLQNMICAFTVLRDRFSNIPAVVQYYNNALTALNSAQNTLNNGGVPDILLTYKIVSTNIGSVSIYEPANVIAANYALTNSLLPIGLINYYYVPATLVP